VLQSCNISLDLSTSGRAVNGSSLRKGADHRKPNDSGRRHPNDGLGHQSWTWSALDLLTPYSPRQVDHRSACRNVSEIFSDSSRTRDFFLPTKTVERIRLRDHEILDRIAGVVVFLR
jgi:hypothetical protein